jgi:predicted nucleotidyltransferase
MNKRVVKEDIISFISAHKDDLKRNYGVRKIGLFGSYAKGEAFEGSDIDIVVELDKPDLSYLIGIKQTFEEALGSKVDVIRLRDNMNRLLRSRIQKDAVYV